MLARSRSRSTLRRRSRLWIVAVAGVCLVGFLYYRPVKAYISTSHQLAERSAEVHALAKEKSTLEQRLASSGTGQTLLEEARRLDFIRPGEHLYIVRGIKGWLKVHQHAGG
ncbi:MAG TPA: septum formation initiator family protein [Gaiellaceae bacterium]|nr:septum formation initiator family protein [Gaiellaceae bacterium]